MEELDIRLEDDLSRVSSIISEEQEPDDVIEVTVEWEHGVATIRTPSGAVIYPTLQHHLAPEMERYFMEVWFGGERASNADSFAELGIEDGGRISMPSLQEDVLSEELSENGQVICNRGKTVTKTGGSDYTSTMGSAMLQSGHHYWHLRIDKMVGNIRIGVAHPEFDFKRFPPRGYESRADSIKESCKDVWFVRSPGNASDAHNRAAGEIFEAAEWGGGDLLSVSVDVDAGTICWLKNGEPMCEKQSNLVGPVRLIVSLDYNEEMVTMLSDAEYGKQLNDPEAKFHAQTEALSEFGFNRQQRTSATYLFG
jgi:hypothetical protein